MSTNINLTTFSSSFCRVCEDIAKKSDNQVLTCKSCRLCFRTYALLSFDKLSCDRNKNCIITQSTQNQSSLPDELRFKSSIMLEMISSFVQEHLPYFRSLSLHSRGTVMKCKFLPGDEIFRTTTIDLYGSDYGTMAKLICQRLEENFIFVKILVLTLDFPSNSSIVIYDSKEDLESIISSTDYIHIQNTYATI
ncbi:hypothetical protein I4U23_021593 [Adineta vaga]|nr:hypothetical protein I4U23_021593 [Adineta vaga]